MTEILTANVGSYPRIGEDKDQQRHRRALAHLQNREISSHAFHDVEQSVIQEVTKEQIESGLDEVTDGQVSWHDPISHFSRKCKGVRFRSLARFFSTNTYYRIPVFVGNPSRMKPATVNNFVLTQAVSNKPVRAVLTGPVTLALLAQSDVKKFNKFENRLAFFTNLLADEIAELCRNQAVLIQLDEPGLVNAPEFIPFFKKAFHAIMDKASPPRLILNLAHGPALTIYPHLLDLPLLALHMDFIRDGKKLLDAVIHSPPSFTLGIGIVNAQNTRSEPIDAQLQLIRTLIDKTSPNKIYLSPSCGLDFLPRPYAFNRCKLLVKIKDEVYA